MRCLDTVQDCGSATRVCCSALQRLGNLPAKSSATAQATKHMAALEDHPARAARAEQRVAESAVHHPGGPFSACILCFASTQMLRGESAGPPTREHPAIELILMYSAVDATLYLSHNGEPQMCFAVNELLPSLLCINADSGLIEVPVARPHGCPEWSHSGVCAEAGQASLRPPHWPQCFPGATYNCPASTSVFSRCYL